MPSAAEAAAEITAIAAQLKQCPDGDKRKAAHNSQEWLCHMCSFRTKEWAFTVKAS
jgi:hypothetical protein